MSPSLVGVNDFVLKYVAVLTKVWSIISRFKTRTFKPPSNWFLAKKVSVRKILKQSSWCRLESRSCRQKFCLIKREESTISSLKQPLRYWKSSCHLIELRWTVECKRRAKHWTLFLSIARSTDNCLPSSPGWFTCCRAVQPILPIR